MKHSPEELKSIYTNSESRLLQSQDRFAYYRFDFNVFPNHPGVYAIYFFDELVYIGETADLKKRMKDLKNTYNHTFRRKLGFHFFEDAKIEGQKFSEIIENRLDLIFANCITVSFIEVNFGRTEIENHLIQNNQNLFNSKTRRGN